MENEQWLAVLCVKPEVADFHISARTFTVCWFRADALQEFVTREICIPNKTGLPEIIRLIKDCGKEGFLTVAEVRPRLLIVTGDQDALLENLLTRFQLHAESLEAMVSDRQRALLQEQARCDGLLNEIIPPYVTFKRPRGGFRLSKTELAQRTSYNENFV